MAFVQVGQTRIGAQTLPTGGGLIRGITEVKPTVHVKGIIHIINSLSLKGPLNSQLFKGQIMCVMHPWPPTSVISKAGI